MKQPAYFIEVIKSYDGSTRLLKKNHIRLLQWSLQVNKKFGIETVAIFKVYPHPKPVIAEYDKEINAIIVSNE